MTEIHALGLRIGLPASLAEIGVERDQLRAMAEAAAGIKRLIDNSPRPLDADALEAILDAAWHGEPGAAEQRRGGAQCVRSRTARSRCAVIRASAAVHVAGLEHVEHLVVLVPDRRG